MKISLSSKYFLTLTTLNKLGLRKKMSNENSKMILGKTLEEASAVVKNQEIIQDGKVKTFIFNIVSLLNVLEVFLLRKITVAETHMLQ